MTSDVRTFALGLPKAELHLHLEGTLEPELMFALARRNGVRLPYGSPEEAREAYAFADLSSFLELYYAGCAALVTEQDFYDLTWAYLERAAAENVRHVEPFFDPQTHLARGVAIDEQMRGILRALKDGESRLGITYRLIMCVLRDLPADDALRLLDVARPWKPHVVGIGLDSAEVGNPPEKFAEVFERARAEGYRVTAHAGEEGPASYVERSIDVLGAERIDHGVRCMEDPRLVARLARERVPFTVCPLSNVRLRVVGSLGEHPLKRMMDAGLLCTVNSDDPAYFGGYVTDNYVAAAEALGLSRDDLVTLAANSFEASFLDRPAKAAHVAAVRRYGAAR